ncbi:selenium-dependent molybdenum cofactor biosynthesis protein YqeB [Tindallia californiensis]|uniref:Xanthine dehydrogenase accessory factor n=1 Tax=Tindallia californiensis TaxID=159292 RepID=A0A1H3Q674_9FIRM|nr:selenium-dependent molybdenum cofactor biosynthesis protein YqeB [Tindallia californiensis]SDZ08760.1 xanthine dehydrogenase accessory factor [Tindallia californiensis]
MSHGIKVAVRSGGDLGTAIIHKLHRSGFKVLVLETENPLAIRLKVAFSEAVSEGSALVEGIEAQRIEEIREIEESWEKGIIPVLVDPEADILNSLSFDVVVDAVMAKKNLGTHRKMAPITIALGPGFVAGTDVDIVIETNRGHHLGRLIFEGSAEPDTGSPGDIMGITDQRVIKAPKEGILKATKKIGDLVKRGEKIGEVEGSPVITEIDGVLRGLIKDGTYVTKSLKIADVDPRGKLEYCYTISEKGRNIAGGVLEAILLMKNQGR